ncbi:MAG: lipid-A-disaccharide synthase [Amylibacter sp.]
MIAGELSGDKLGASLIEGLRYETDQKIIFSGIGGPLMEAAGLKSLFNISDLSLMGLAEIIPKIPMLLSRINTTANSIINQRPDVLITIDSPDFCMRVAKKVRKAHPKIKIIHYVAPSVWAWRPERAAKMSKYVDHVLALLPFEPPYMEAEGMTSDFVGHPVVFSPNVTVEAQKKFKKQHNLHDGPIITILPGSRISEINRMCPIFDKVTSNIQKLYPNVQFVLPVALTVEEDVIKAVNSWHVKPLLLLNSGKDSKQIEYDKFITYSISSAALATSGTVALELAAKKCPMVIAYKANWLTTKIVKRLAKIDTANLINIITNTKVIPEHLFENCTVEKITNSLNSLLNSDNNQISAMSEAMNKLGINQEDIHLLAAKSVLKILK